MQRLKFQLWFVSVALLAVWMRPAVAESPCEVGIYQGPDSDFVMLVERSKPGEFGYSFRDGRFGRPGDDKVACVRGGISVQQDGVSQRWPAMKLRLTPTRFRSGDVLLQGVLVEPPGTDAQRPLVVVVHGSENTASIRRNPYPYLFAAQGISAFVFDKRGTGASQGTYTQNFHRLAADVVAASVEAKRLARGRFGRFGLFGGSQGGWVAPRAANEAHAEFVAVGFGLLINPLDEDAEQVATELAALGYDDATLAQARAGAREVTDATGELLAAHFAAGYERLAAARQRYAHEPWFGKIKGEYTGDILALDEATLRREGRKRFDNLDIDWRYDSIGHLRAVQAPQLWVIAGADREAPPEVTVERLQRLRAEGRAIDIVIFPNTDHGIYEFAAEPDGERRMIRVSDGYYRLLADWIRGSVHPPYGNAQFVAGRPAGP